MKKVLLVSLISLALSGLGLGGCTSVKVDCEKMCQRTFKECVGEVMLASGKMKPETLRTIEKAGALVKVREAGYKNCMEQCDKNKGYPSDAGKINKCLEMEDCKPFAECIQKHLK